MKTEKITLDDIVFENRNKEYGAYYLRTHYEEHLFKAFFYGTSVVLLLFAFLYYYLKIQGPAMGLPLENTGVIIDVTDYFQKKPEIIPSSKKSAKVPQFQQKAVLPPVAVADNTRTQDAPLPDMTNLDDYLIGTVDVAGIPTTDGLGMLTQPSNNSGTGTAEPPKPAEPDKTFEKAEIDPSFVGGINAMYKFLSKNLNYPPQASRANVEGKVFVKFVVEKDGSIGQIEIMKGVGFGCDEEAVRVIKSMPRWNPGKQNGQNVRVYYTMPIWFKLD